ncbi:hypothetical protein HPB48_010706 [Haemaphysalis longicornis]|uniref:Uncharacterized protein n=1 Tax=Haemaphysalis longicornis TaxID=44386 RepID=A0A9J6GAG4_HAELO|nr:hypothetical protein HPB48_010706 [Haemaphysalis longicornis]
MLRSAPAGKEESGALSSSSPVSALRTVPSLLAPVAGPLMFLGAAYYLFSFLPSALPTIISVLGLKARLVPYLTSIGLREALNLESVGRRIEPALERGFEAIDVHEGECRRRAACEVGQWLARSHPTVAKVVDLFRCVALSLTYVHNWTAEKGSREKFKHKFA